MPQKFNADNPPPPGAAEPGAVGEAKQCRTAPLVPDFSICLSKDRLCPYALSFGHQYLCRHPDHAKFVVPSKRS